MGVLRAGNSHVPMNSGAIPPSGFIYGRMNQEQLIPRDKLYYYYLILLFSVTFLHILEAQGTLMTHATALFALINKSVIDFTI